MDQIDTSETNRPSRLGWFVAGIITAAFALISFQFAGELIGADEANAADPGMPKVIIEGN